MNLSLTCTLRHTSTNLLVQLILLLSRNSLNQLPRSADTAVLISTNQGVDLARAMKSAGKRVVTRNIYHLFRVHPVIPANAARRITET